MNETWKGDGTRRNSSEGLDKPAPEDFRAGENARGMEGQCDCTNIQRELDIQDCGNYRRIKMMSHTMKIWERKTEGGDRHRRRAVRFHAGQRDN